MIEYIRILLALYVVLLIYVIWSNKNKHKDLFWMRIDDYANPALLVSTIVLVAILLISLGAYLTSKIQ